MIRRQASKFDLDESIWVEWGPVKRCRRRLLSTLYCLPDTGLFGLTPLRTHIVICGYQRAGTTLLLMMMEYALPEARRFGKETAAWRAAAYSWRNHSVMISKVPVDVFRLHRVRNFYKSRKARLKSIIMIRDPRDVLTSHHSRHQELQYFQDLDQWKDLHAAVSRYLHEPDVMMLKYEDLVADPDAAQAKVEAFTGEKSPLRWADAHQQQRSDFDTAPLNGVRPVEASGVGRWALPEHRPRIEQVLREVPDFPQILIDLDYEKDRRWLDIWRAAAAPDQPCDISPVAAPRGPHG